MKAYTIAGGTLFEGIQIGVYKNDTLVLADGNGEVPVFRKNPPLVTYKDIKVATDVHPIRILDGWALAKPNHADERILVRVSTRNTFASGEIRGNGNWWFDPKTAGGPQSVYQTLLTVEAKDGWHDSLIIMKPGQRIGVRDQSGVEHFFCYQDVGLPPYQEN